MRVLVLQNYPDTGPGQLGRVLEGKGIGLDLCRLDGGEALPESPGDHAGLLVLGGAQNALDDAGSPYFPALLDLVRRFDAQDRPVLGICLGAQLVARAFGGENRIGGASEFGWREVELTEDGERDALTGVLPPRFRSFQWHDDTFGLPPDAVRLAASPVATQAFRVGCVAYGVQFHFEADRAVVRHWSETLRAHLAETQPDWAARHAGEEARHGEQADEAGRQLAKAWAALL